MLHCVISNTGLTEREFFCAFWRKESSTNTARYAGEHRTTGSVKTHPFLLKEVLVILSHLLPPNLSSILVDNNIFRNMGISEFYPHRYTNRYTYGYLDQIFLFNKIIKSHYQEIKKKKNKTNPTTQKQRLAASPEWGTCLTFPQNLPSCGTARLLENKNKPTHLTIQCCRSRKKKSTSNSS